MGLVISQKNGVSALGLQRVLGLGSYETAWTGWHTLRRAIVRRGRALLSGVVEVDETSFERPEEGRRGREPKPQGDGRGAAEKRERGTGRIHLKHITAVSANSLLPFMQGAVAPGSEVHSDGGRGYAGLSAVGSHHRVTVICGGSWPAHVVMPCVHLVPSLLKRWLAGTHQGGIQQPHLDDYLDEFTFRFNRRPSKARGRLFPRLAQQTVAGGPKPDHALIHPTHSKSGAMEGE